NAQITFESLPVLQAEKNQLYQVFLTLINNALKFSQVELPAQISISSAAVTLDEKKYWQITIADNGIGFEQQYADKIFEIFQRLHGRSQYEGTGIGLAVCKKIIDRHNGKISVESELGKGSRFILSLPQ
ncbi:MAG: ATP-binding protein, partial [Pseudomonadales bacterium]|nr:ATP-binding protein [Pseudomonadales bacterium]